MMLVTDEISLANAICLGIEIFYSNDVPSYE